MVRSFDLGEDAIQPSFERVGQPGEEIELWLQEFAGKVSKPPSINKQADYDENGLVVSLGWIAKLAKFFGFVEATDLQQRLSKKGHGHRTVAMVSAAHASHPRENRQLSVSGEKVSYEPPKTKQFYGFAFLRRFGVRFVCVQSLRSDTVESSKPPRQEQFFKRKHSHRN